MSFGGSCGGTSRQRPRWPGGRKSLPSRISRDLQVCFQRGEGRGIPRRLACLAFFASSDTGLHGITHALACIWLCLMPFTPACVCAAGARAYLLGDMEDFWALSDLVDLSRGASSPLTRWLVKAEAETAALSK